MPDRSRRVAIAGGSVAGLATALAFAQGGHEVIVFETDAAPLPESPEQAFTDWDRHGSPQTRHSHAFLARLHVLLRDRAPDLLALLFEHGAGRMAFRDMAAKVLPDAEFLPGDDDIELLACRRLTFEWALRRTVESLPNVTLRGGVSVEGVLAEPGAPPRLTGLRVSAGRGAPSEEIAAELVIDATGRRTRIGAWLEEIGAGPLRQESEPCGIFYSSRFYRVRDDAEMPVLDGPMGADLGFLKYGIFPGDARTFSITLAASPEDAPMRALFREPAFEALAASLPATSAWVDPAVATPISDVVPMANLHNTRRFPVDDGEPLALGLACVGDALMHTNPIVGRGCTLAFVNAYLIADAFADHSDDPRAFALDLADRVEAEIVPWYEGVREQDRDAIAVNELLRRNEDPFAVNRADGSVDPRAYLRSVLRDGFLPALRQDVGVLRAFMRVFNLLDAPTDLMKDPKILGTVLAVYQKRDERDPTERGPTRDQVIAQLESLAA